MYSKIDGDMGLAAQLWVDEGVRNHFEKTMMWPEEWARQRDKAPEMFALLIQHLPDDVRERIEDFIFFRIFGLQSLCDYWKHDILSRRRQTSDADQAIARPERGRKPRDDLDLEIPL